MAKFKICPFCGAKNAPSLMDCENCSADLMGVRIMDEDDEPKPETSPLEEPSKVLVRICDCGAQNPSNARKCSACGEDISDILPTELEAAQEKYRLTSLDGTFAYDITEDEVVVGREHELQCFLAGKSYVSRKQCRFYMQDGKLYLENLSSTNPTFVNDQQIGSVVEVKDGDEVGLGGFCKDGKRQELAAYLLVRKI